jgi:hypothetical protein
MKKFVLSLVPSFLFGTSAFAIGVVGFANDLKVISGDPVVKQQGLVLAQDEYALSQVAFANVPNDSRDGTYTVSYKLIYLNKQNEARTLRVELDKAIAEGVIKVRVLP